MLIGNAYRANLALFYRKGHNQIDWVRSDPEEPWTVSNIADLNTYGIEVGLDLFTECYLPDLPLSRVNLSYGWLTSDKETEDYESKYALSYLRHHILLKIDHRLPWKLEQMWKLQYKDRLNAGSYSVVDTRIQRRIRLLTLSISVTNLFDAAYEEIGSVSMPGRWFKAGFIYNLD